ncbi:hypothetical protein [Nocardia sp. NPDC056000]|uniref:hypothetical protein n=1 Tax=Nocardia sp. NPDC056000 TaxID=3345674 RepID=UPI0035DECEC9
MCGGDCVLRDNRHRTARQTTADAAADSAEHTDSEVLEVLAGSGPTAAHHPAESLPDFDADEGTDDTARDTGQCRHPDVGPVDSVPVMVRGHPHTRREHRRATPNRSHANGIHDCANG